MKEMQYHPKELLEATKTKIWGYNFPPKREQDYCNIMANKLAQAFRERNIHTIFERKQSINHNSDQYRVDI